MEKEVKDFIKFIEETKFTNASYFSVVPHEAGHGYKKIQCTKESAILFATEILKGAYYEKENDFDSYYLRPNIDEFDLLKTETIQIVKEKPTPPKFENNDTLIYKVKLTAFVIFFTLVSLFLIASLFIGGFKVVVYLVGLF